jgi:hypothetical protein
LLLSSLLASHSFTVCNTTQHGITGISYFNMFNSMLCADLMHAVKCSVAFLQYKCATQRMPHKYFLPGLKSYNKILFFAIVFTCFILTPASIFRQTKIKTCSFARRSFCPYFTSMLTYNFFHNRQPNTGTLKVFCTVQSLKNFE